MCHLKYNNIVFQKSLPVSSQTTQWSVTERVTIVGDEIPFCQCAYVLKL